MADENRFSNLETTQAPLPQNVQAAISRLNRFETLEIAGAHLAAPVKPYSTDRLLCPACGQANERARDLCWACYKPLSAASLAMPDSGQEVCVVLEGVSYRSSDPKLPDDVKELITRIRSQGYSTELLKDWQNWRTTRHSDRMATPQNEASAAFSNKDRIQAFKGQRVSVLRIDGTVYTSDDPAVPPEIKELFGYIDKEGVTPALMQHLRLYGTKVKYRPLSTPLPSDGDLNFWDAAKKAAKG